MDILKEGKKASAKADKNVKPAGSYIKEFSNELDEALGAEAAERPSSDVTTKSVTPKSTKAAKADEAERMIDGAKADGDLSWEHSLRPQQFDDFPGQDRVKDKLKVFVEAAKAREEALDHILLSGPPGLGKTTLSHIIANTMGVDFKSTSGPALDRKGDLAAILTSLRPNSVLFIDEIHRLSRTI